MGRGSIVWVGAVAAVLAVGAGASARAEDAKAIIQQAVKAELQADRDDHSHWRYLEKEDGGDLYVVVETGHGALRRHVQEHGRPASAKTLEEDDAHNQRFIHDPGMQEKQRRDGQHDDKSATELLNLMPEAFLWTVQSETPETVTLSYKPNPGFSPPDMEARVMGGMAGTLVMVKDGHRIKTFKGRLEQDVTIGFGFLARIKAGSTFDIERRQIGPGIWQIAETHVHISGHALFFRTIGTQEDEVKSDFTAVPDGTTLEQAAGMLKAPVK